MTLKCDRWWWCDSGVRVFFN